MSTAVRPMPLGAAPRPEPLNPAPSRWQGVLRGMARVVTGMVAGRYAEVQAVD